MNKNQKAYHAYTLIINDHGSIVSLQYDSMAELQDELIDWLETRSSIFGFQVQAKINDVPAVLDLF